VSARTLVAVAIIGITLVGAPAVSASAASAVTAQEAATPTLRRGASGSAVARLQQILSRRGNDPGAADGRFGPRTQAAVLAFQRANGLKVDGIVGPITWRALLADSAAPVTPAPTTTTVDAAVAPAETPSMATWDALARCESGGRWDLNLGTGYYGGLQFRLASWTGAGGVGYPHEATREEQIRRGIVLWQRYGWKPWPACSRKLGLA
jgi:peptidoglycan hydrolase-like protein with peptidoglycan-binding domain